MPELLPEPLVPPLLPPLLLLPLVLPLPPELPPEPPSSPFEFDDVPQLTMPPPKTAPVAHIRATEPTIRVSFMASTPSRGKGNRTPVIRHAE